MQFPFMIIEVTQLTKTFGAFTAVNEVSFALKEGEILGLLGPNGAGKTTTILMLLGLITPTSGSIRIFNRGYDRDRERILAGMNFCAPYISFPGRLSVYENLMVFARLYQVHRPGRKIMELLLRFGIEPLKNRPVLLLSSGENTRVALCKALLNNPHLLLLDEPTAFLDPQIAGLVKRVLRELREEHGSTIIYTTHNMSDAEEMCSHMVFLSHGRIIARGTALEITQAILDDKRDKPALVEAFLHVADSIK
jgi:ABC-2 type transport system ATP-binding protein